MSQSWFSGMRKADGPDDAPDASFDYADATEAEALESGAAYEAAPQPGMSRALVALLIMLALAAIGWIALTGWSLVDPQMGRRLATILDLAVYVSTPLTLIVGLALLAVMAAGSRRSRTPDARHLTGQANALASQTAQSAQRMAEAHSQLLSQTRAYAKTADLSASALLDAVETMASRGGELTRTTDQSVGALTALSARMDGFETNVPQLEQRLNSLTETLACLGAELGEHSHHLEARLKDTAGAAEEARTQLIASSRSLGEQLGTLRGDAKAAGEELASLSDLSSARIDLTLDRVRTILQATEERIEAQNTALTHLAEQSSERIAAASNQTIEQFSAHCADIEASLDSFDTRMAAQSDKSSRWLDMTAHGVKTLAEQFDALEQSAMSRTERLGTAVMQLSGETRRLVDAIEAGDGASDQLIKRAESLLLALDSGIRELDESLPAAIGRVESRLTIMRQHITAAGPDIEAVEAVAAGVVSRLDETDKVAAAHAARLDQALLRAQTALTAQQQQVEALNGAITQAGDGMARLGEQVGPQMIDSLLRVRETADAAARNARNAIMAVIPKAAASLGEASAEAIRNAVTASVTDQLEALTHTADHAVTIAREAAGTLDTQLRTLEDASAALEKRLESSAQRIDAQGRDVLARRSAELIEMLNSRAIDVSKWLGHDVSQVEWTAYLGGDQGVFARRSVRMLGRTELRAILSLYQDQPDFADHVNRYVHDFEALLRRILDARDGSALAVTMLSSDLGKLYVALAQATDRLKAN